MAAHHGFLGVAPAPIGEPAALGEVPQHHPFGDLGRPRSVDGPPHRPIGPIGPIGPTGPTGDLIGLASSAANKSCDVTEDSGWESLDPSRYSALAFNPKRHDNM